MKSLILHSISVLSLLLCIAAAFLLVRSRGRLDLLGSYNANNGFWCSSSAGQLVVAWSNVDRGSGTFGQVIDNHGMASPMFKSYPPGTGGAEMCDFYASAWDQMLKLKAAVLIHGWRGFESMQVSGKMPGSFANGSVSFTPVGIPVIRFKAVGVPFWSLVAIFLAPPAMVAILANRKRTRKIAGHCSVCGYDLRATPDRCPECGSVP